MNDDRLQRVGKPFSQMMTLLPSDAPPAERVATFTVLLGQLSHEYQASEDEAREEGRRAGYAQGRTDAWPEGWAAGYDVGVGTGAMRGQQQAKDEAERRITGEPVTLAEAEADTAAPGETGGEAPDTESARGSVH